MIWFRIDNRLIHGQIIEAWLPYLNTEFLIVANDALANDPFRQQIASLAVPKDVALYFVTLNDLQNVFTAKIGCQQLERCMVLFENFHDACVASQMGIAMDIVNIGNIHYSKGRELILPHVAISQEDRNYLQYFHKLGVNFDFRRVPTETVRVSHAIF